MRIVLIGDLHFYSLGLRPWDLLSKRILGQTNLWPNRRLHFRLDRIGPLIEQVHAARPDRVLFSGDLTTTALHSEFEMARKRLSPLLERYDGLIVPGNHDRYTFTAARTRRLERYFPDHAPASYPFHRRLDEKLHLIALDPTRPNFITDRGSLAPTQLRAMRGLLESLETDDRLIVLCHYTLNTPQNPRAIGASGDEPSRHRLTDASQLLDLLRSHRPTLYLHGHVHQPWCYQHPLAPNLTVVNAGAPLIRGQGFWTIDVGPAGWQITHHAVQ